MARFFREQDIDEFRECFYLFARSGKIRTVDELTIIMRSLGMSPTITELKKYYKDKGGQISFADFLDIMHTHTKRENIPQEILDAFRACDPSNRGVISVRDLKHILQGWGEKLNPREAERFYREAKIPQSGQVRYEDMMKVICAPAPDYY